MIFNIPPEATIYDIWMSQVPGCLDLMNMPVLLYRIEKHVNGQATSWDKESICIYIVSYIKYLSSWSCREIYAFHLNLDTSMLVLAVHYLFNYV